MNTVNWHLLREEYLQGGVTQSELARRHGVPVGSLRRRAAAEGWCSMRKSRESGLQEDTPAVSSRVAAQLALTDRMVTILTRALEDDAELYRHVKSTSGGDFSCEQLPALDEERAGRIVKLMGELFEQQRIILGKHEYKDELSAAKLAQDERLANSKLDYQNALAERQNSLAERKLELELLKLEGLSGGTDPEADGFLAALGMTGDESLYEQP